MNLENLTPFSAVCLPFMDLHNQDIALVIVAGRFCIPAPGQPADDVLPVHPQQQLVPIADTYVGAPGRSSLYWPGQASCQGPGTDIYLHGHACAPTGRQVSELPIAVRVGAYERQALVFGDRTWRRGILRLLPSEPEPFTRMPLVYERSFGGWLEQATGRTAQAAEHNPVGRGLYADAGEAAGQPLPNLEDPRALIRSPEDRPLPQGFGPLARHWLPRRTFCGHYDEAWLATQAPLWPDDVDSRFFSAAAPGLCATPALQGGEQVALTGMNPAGPLRFLLPRWPLVAKFHFRHGIARRPLRLDAVMLLGPANCDGRIPSEAAGFLLVAHAQCPDTHRVLAQVLPPEEGADRASFDSVHTGAALNVAHGLTELFRRVLSQPAVPPRVDCIISAQPGEGFWGREVSYAYLRNVQRMPEPLRLEFVGAELGDTAAAAGLVALLRALASLRPPAWSIEPPSHSALVYGVSDTGAIGACVLLPAPV